MTAKASIKCDQGVLFHHEPPEELQYWMLPIDIPFLGVLMVLVVECTVLHLSPDF